MALESVAACPVCSCTHFTPHLHAQDHTTTGETFSLLRCDLCHLIITSPRPTAAAIGRYYQSPAYISHTSATATWLDKVYQRARAFNLRTKRQLIERFQTRGSLLDYGCGTGHFFAHMKRFGWTGEAIEPATTARARAALEINQPVHATWRTLPDMTFQAITLWHVLEHVHDLANTVEQLKTRLSTTGTLFVAVPNHLSHDARHYRQHWAAYDVPRHLWHFHRPAMTQLLAKHRLRVTDVAPMMLDSYYVSLLSEQYQHPHRAKAVRLLSAFLQGWKSNRHASQTGEYSSLIYIVNHA